MLAVLVAAAADAAGSRDWVQWAIDQGGAFIGLLIVGYGWKREAKRADTERAARDVLVAQFMDRVIPALEKSTAANVEASVAIARTLPR